MRRHWIDRHKALFSFAASFYVWGSLSPGSNMERFLSGRYWELLPHYNPLAFGIALGIIAAGLGLAYIPDLVVRLRRGSSRRLADRLTEAMNAGAMRAPSVVLATPSRDALRPRPPAGTRTIGAPAGSPPPFPPESLPSAPPPASLPSTPPSSGARAPTIRLDSSREQFREDVRSAFGFVARPIEELIRPIPLYVERIGLTEPALCPQSRDRVTVNYLGVCFTARSSLVSSLLVGFEETVRAARIRVLLPMAIDLTDYLDENRGKTPADALGAYEAATQPAALETSEDGPSAPAPIVRLSLAGVTWKAEAPRSLTWREIASFTSVVRGVRAALPDLSESIVIPATDAGPLLDLEAALDRMTRRA